MYIRKATKRDLNAINALQGLYGKMTVDPKLINHRDISLVAISSSPDADLLGFVWGGLMAGNSLMYIDKVVVHPGASGRGVLNALYRELFERGLKIGVKTGIGLIKRDKYHDKSAINALKMAFAADPIPYTYVFGDTAHMVSELSLLEAS